MSDREIQEFTTVGGHKVAIKTYLTAREAMGVIDGGELSTTKKSQMLLEQAIVSLDDSAENIGERLLDLPLADYTAIAKEANAIITPTEPGSSAQPGSDTSTSAQ